MPPANHCAAFPQEESLLATGGTTKNVQGMLRQDALQVRGPLPIANAQSTPLAPAHMRPINKIRPAHTPNMRPPHTHGLRRLSHHNCKQASHPEGNFNVLRWCKIESLLQPVLLLSPRRAAADAPHMRAIGRLAESEGPVLFARFDEAEKYEFIESNAPVEAWASDNG